MKKFQFKIRGNNYDVEIKNVENSIAEIEVNGTSYHVEIEQEQRKRSKTPTIVRKQQAPKRTESKIKKQMSGGEQIKAPLPGTILKITTKEGDSVKKGDNVLIMEAMKMENNIMATRDGVVKSIKVTEGESVLQDDVLVEIE